MPSTRRRLIALATHQGQPDLTPDDAPLVAAFDDRGVDAQAAPWDAPDFPWPRCDAVIIRSCWNYHLHLDRFLAWIAHLEATGIAIRNPAPLVRWNSRKDYLRDLATAGVPVVPTTWVPRNDSRTLTTVLTEAGCAEAVVKPTVSASAHETWRTSTASANADETRFRRLVAQGDVMVQPYLAEVTRQGEWSIVFLDGQFSHAVLKRARPGDFRVQHTHGGTYEAQAPDAALVRAAATALAAAPAPSLYARVDGCVVGGQFVLMELELIEPMLFLAGAPGASERLVEAALQSLDAAAS